MRREVPTCRPADLPTCLPDVEEGWQMRREVPTCRPAYQM